MKEVAGGGGDLAGSLFKAKRQMRMLQPLPQVLRHAFSGRYSCGRNATMPSVIIFPEGLGPWEKLRRYVTVS